jgi:phage/plasmid-like protein (TIGR03299 family)
MAGFGTAGALGKGEKIWLLAKLPDQIRVKNSDDLVDKFLLLSNAHDGSAALRAFFTPIRVVCQNALSMAESGGRGQGISITHKGNLSGKIREAQQVLGLAQKFYDAAEAKIDMLANHYPTKEQLKHFFEALDSDPEEEKSNTRAKNVREDDERQLTLPSALTHRFGDRKPIVASRGCCQTSEAHDGRQEDQQADQERVA